MADDEHPKDYSALYSEDSSRSLGLPLSNTCATPKIKNLDISVRSNTCRTKNYQKPVLDGARSFRRPESDLFSNVAKLQNHQQKDQCAYALETLSKHYSSVFSNRRKTDNKKEALFKAFIQYSEENDTYVVRVEKNTLRSVKDKLPKRGNYRFFFKQLDGTCEEIELDESIVPYHVKGESKYIYCQVFLF